MSFVADYGGTIARQISGKWKGTLASPQAIAGLTAFKNFFSTVSRASKTTDETRPNPYDVYAQGQAGSMIGPGWFSCCVGDKYKATTGQFVLPSRQKGQPMPGFLGGSILAVPVGTNKSLAVDWVKAYTSNQSMTALRAIGNIPNTTSLLGSERQRAGGPAQLVRPDGEELGQRGERQHPPEHARPDPHRQALRQAGRPVGQRQHHVGAQRLRT